VVTLAAKDTKAAPSVSKNAAAKAEPKTHDSVKTPSKPVADSKPTGVHTTTFQNPRGGSQSIVAKPGANVYSAADWSGLHLPASCKQGSCSSCVCKVLEGNVHHKSNPACLTPKLKAEGYVAICVASVSGDATLLTHQGVLVRRERAAEEDRMQHRHG